MLMIAHSLGEIRFPELMEVYRDSMEEAASDWPNLPRGFALERAEQDYRQYLREVFFRTPGALYAMWEESGKYVSALRLEPYRDGLLLAGLETAPDFRKMGYAALLIRSVQKEPGIGKIYSHVSKGNIASLKTHESCGFRVISDHAVYISGSVDYRCCTMVFEG